MSDKPYCTVVFDTSPVRELAHCNHIPDWVDIFAAMKKDGYRFSLSDQAAGELLHQKHIGSIEHTGFGIMITCLKKFLDTEFPIMLGEVDVMETIGARARRKIIGTPTKISKRGWSMFENPDHHVQGLGTIIQEEREDWKSMFSRWSRLDSSRPLNEIDDPELDSLFFHINKLADIDPPLSVRLDLKLRYAWRQFVRSKKVKDNYNVGSSKKRNDGIDFGLYTYLALPAFVIATERGFHSSIQNIPSYQRAWIFRPSDLAEIWSAGKRPRPIWPNNSNA